MSKTAQPPLTLGHTKSLVSLGILLPIAIAVGLLAGEAFGSTGGITGDAGLWLSTCVFPY